MKKWNIGWGISSKCNMQCQFCYSQNKRRQEADLNIFFWKRFVNQNAEYINAINYGTGENSLLKEWFDFIDYVRMEFPQIRQAITTNGYLGDAVSMDARLSRIVETSIDEVDVSLDFADNRRHNTFRGQPQAYGWALKTMEFCREKEIPLTVVMLGCKETMTEENLEAMFAIIKRYHAVLRVNIFRPAFGISPLSEKFILPAEQLYSILNYVNQKHKIVSVNDALLAAVLLDEKSEDPSGNCSIRILPNGNITPSTYLIDDSYVVGNIRENIVLNAPEFLNKISSLIKNEIPKECKFCEYVSKCQGGVLDRRYLWKGSLKEKDPYCIKSVMKNTGMLNKHEDEFHSIHADYLPTMFFRE